MFWWAGELVSDKIKRQKGILTSWTGNYLHVCTARLFFLLDPKTAVRAFSNRPHNFVRTGSAHNARTCINLQWQIRRSRMDSGINMALRSSDTHSADSRLQSKILEYKSTSNIQPAYQHGPSADTLLYECLHSGTRDVLLPYVPQRREFLGEPSVYCGGCWREDDERGGTAAQI